MSISRFARADAAYQEEITAQWRDWRTYLQAHQTLLTIRVAEARAAFERAESQDTHEARARAELAALPASRRALFERVYETRRQRTQADMEAEARLNSGSQARPLDPDQVDRRTLAILLAEAEGRQSDDGWGLVPIDDDEWYRVDVAALEAAPSAAAYAAGRSEANDRRRRLGILAGLVGAAAILLLIWLLLRPAPRITLPGSAILVNGTPVTVWTPVMVQVSGSDGVTVTLAVRQATTWPELGVADTVGWNVNQPAPLTLCVPAGVLADATTVRIRGVGAVPERIYTLRPASETPADLVLEVCGAGRDQRARSGVLRATIPLADLTLGQEGALSEERAVTLIAADLADFAADATLPDGQARVILTVRAPPDLDWPAYAPTLLLANGDTALPSMIEPAGDATTFTYLLPLPNTAIDAAWSMTTPEKRQIRWRFRLTPPPARDEVLRHALVVESVTAANGVADELEVTITLRHGGATPLLLTSADLGFTQGETPLNFTMISGLDQPLAPGETRTLALSVVPGHTAQPLTLRVGHERFRMTWNS